MKRDIRKAVEEIKVLGWRISYTKIQAHSNVMTIALQN